MKGLIGMGVNYFTDEQIKILKDNPYIEKISYKSIKYSQKFKMEFWSRYSQGEAPSSILSSFDIDSHNLGPKRISNIVQRIKKEAERLEGFEDTRKHNAGRPRTRDMSPEEKIVYLEHKIAYQKQEIEFLKKIRSLEREAYWKLQKKNTKSSKK